MRKEFSPHENKAGTYTIESVSRAPRLLQTYGQGDADFSLTELAQRIELSTSTVFRLVQTLQGEGWLRRDQQSGRYSLGLKVFHLGSLVRVRQQLREVARPHLERLCQLVGETVHMAVEEDGLAVYLDKVEPERPVRMSTSVGKTVPLFAGSLGKIIVAHMSNERRRDLLQSQPLKPFTAKTVIDPHMLERQLVSIPHDGYALDLQEVYDDVCCIGSPVYNMTGGLAAAMSASGPVSRFTDKRILELVPLVKQTAAAISRDLGYTGPNRS